MAQVKHNHFLDTVDQVFNYAKELKILHLEAQGEKFNGRSIRIEGKDVFHFGTTGYLGLEQDERLKEGAKKAIDNFGTQFPLSKSYIAHPLYKNLEKMLYRIYGQPVVIAKNATLAHMAAIPVIARDNDAILLDHQVHWSVQDAAKRLKLRGVKVELVRHNRLDILEKKIQEISSTVDKIWYMADGVYSMYGDFSPVNKLLKLSKKYKQLHLYFDDVHGMSWFGENGRGYVFEQLQSLPNKVCIVGTLSKTFGANGSFIICGDKLIQQKIKNFGGPLTFSAQLDPASVGAAIASAKIHLSKEITKFQKELKDKIDYFNMLLEKYQLPLVEKNESPVFFIATGVPETGYQLTRLLLDGGFYVNMGLFPAVPSTNTGLRITISRHNQKEDILELTKALAKLYPNVMATTGNTMERLSKAFKQDFYFKEEKVEDVNFKVIQKHSIEEIDRKLWNESFLGEGILDWDGFHFIEKCFRHHQLKEHQWKFFYIQIFDCSGELLVLGAFTLSLWKDDLLTKSSISKQIELKRINDPYFLTSKVLSLGSLFSDGLPLYINKNSHKEQKAVNVLFQTLEDIASKNNASQIILRDFNLSSSYKNTFQLQGFIPVHMPEVCVIEEMKWSSLEEYVNTLSKKSKKHFEKDIAAYSHLVEIETIDEVNEEKLSHFYKLFKNVKNKNFGLNTFTYPKTVFEEMNKSKHWEFICIYIKNNSSETKRAIGVMFCYKNGQSTYVPSLIGLDYTYNEKYQTYRQLLFASIWRANKAGFQKVDFGISANFEKKKLGAKVIPKIAYVQSDTNFKMDYLETQQ
ncbi:aminotransferase class I/II-fold pyridoxal phosphate-dependent enzyme [Mesonia ostreae]|uniref:Aminotransferase class I/II-fold pyridoxal phosphate-dependent enzyme n=1 Tax=Mesonia ostreae TaxID=861110 RepID=A0ABU2KJQ7_9FLAO|nr:aminotransferase class I/II-fold pyridoxal phosphate-dependent enzyme [Mesonia ostreae]MDT0294893.1 aminotransferase class I/II-fold pyridoxal phosphate-dependent enzyme [Mesonia ostreae]